MKNGKPMKAKEGQESNHNGVDLEFKFTRIDIDDLFELLPTKMSGRFMPLKMKVLETLSETPEGQFGLIRIPKEIMANSKELVSIRMAIYNMLMARKLEWVAHVSQPAGGILLVRTNDWKKVRGVK